MSVLDEIQIQDISPTISILNDAKDGASDVQKNLISAQIHALSAMQNPALIESSIDSIMICLENSETLPQTAAEKIIIQEETCLILQGMLYFLYANLLSVQKNTKDKSDELMKISKGQILQAVKISIGVLCVSQGMPVSNLKDFLPNSIQEKLEVKSLLVNVAKNPSAIKNDLNRAVLYLGNRDNLINFSKESGQKVIGEMHKQIDYYKSIKTTKKQESEFYLMLNRVFEKFEHNKALLGSSSVLSELVQTHKSNLVNNFTKAERRNAKVSKWLSGLIFVISGVILLVVYLILLGVDFAFDTGFAGYIHWYFIFFTLLPIVFFQIKLTIKKNQLSKKYESIAAKLRS